MSPAHQLGLVLDGLRGLPVPERLLRLVVPAGTVAFVALASLVGGRLHPVVVTVAVLLALAGALSSGGSAPAFLVLYLVGLWGLAVPERLDGWVLVAAVDLVVIHVAATLLAYGPAGLRLPRGLLLTWGRRSLEMAATAALVWSASRLLGRLEGGATPAVVVGLVVLAGWVVFLLSRLGVLDDRASAR